MSEKFKMGEVEYEYIFGEKFKHNKAVRNERRVEIPLGIKFAEKYNYRIFELGCVMPYYFSEDQFRHPIVDLTDPHIEAIRVDLTGIRDFNQKKVLSISTFEHIRPVNKAVDALEKIFATADDWLITFPLGYTRPFDNEVYKILINGRNNLKWYILKRLDAENNWQEIDKDFDWKTARYKYPFKWANFLCVMVSEKW